MNSEHKGTEMDNKREGAEMGGSKGGLKDVVIAMRPKQWIKNGFVFAGLVFSRTFADPDRVMKTLYAFILFSLLSGSVYIINDVADRKRDRLHPLKSKRPIASGRLKTGKALLISAVLTVISLLSAFYLDLELFFVLAAYYLLVLAYSLRLKHILILDVLLIAAGFVLRTVGGALVIDVQISPWLIVCTTLLALFLALHKRRSELVELSENAANHREILEKYTPELIDQMLSVVTSSTVISYSLYTFNAGKSYFMMLTIPFVLYGIFRYQYLALRGDLTGSPELAFLKDKPLLVNVVLWILTSLVIVTLFY